MTTSTLTVPLIGPGGEPVDLWCTVRSHGLATLPPARLDLTGGRNRYQTVVTIATDGPRAISIEAGPAGSPTVATVHVSGPPLTPAAADFVATLVRRMLALDLDLDLAGFYTECAADSALAWATRGAGRMLRSPSVFEDVVKTICTTNCAWSGTVRMTTALVRHLGAPIPGTDPDDPHARAFPTPEAMAAAPESVYRETVRAGYRSRYLQALAAAVASGTLDLESLAADPASPAALSDDEVASRLLALPGVGPYAAAHIMLLLGRCSRLILDSWTRPTYTRLVRGEGGELVPDGEIVARFSRFGRFAGLAFWLFVTRAWHEPPEQVAAPSPVTEPTASAS